MKNLLIAGAVVVCCTLANKTEAQGRPSLNIGAEVGVPTGTLNNTQKIGIGGSAKLNFPIFEGGAFTVSGGYISFSGDENRVGEAVIKRPALNFIPLKAGLKYMVTPGGFYMEPQLGYTALSTPNNNTSAKGGFAYAYNLGYMLSPAWDISTRYEGLSRDGGSLNFIGFRLGYNIGL